MHKIIRIGMDTSKQIFQLHGVDASERVVLRRKLRRKEVLEFFANLDCFVAALLEMYPDAIYHLAIFGDIAIARRHSALDLRRTSHRFDDATELCKKTITHPFDNVALMLGHAWSDQLRMVGL